MALSTECQMAERQEYMKREKLIIPKEKQGQKEENTDKTREIEDQKKKGTS